AHLDVARDDLEIRPADAADGDLDDDLALPGDGVIHLTQRELVGSREEHRLHARILARRETPGPGPSVSAMKHRDQVRVFQAGPAGERFRDRDEAPARRAGVPASSVSASAASTRR